VVLSADPTADIRNMEKVVSVMLGGSLYDAQTMNAVGPGAQARRPHWWERDAPRPGAGDLP
jgi:hypothetical protein